jgi:glutathione S-transferase
MQRAQVDQWMDFFTCHLGRWITTLYYDAVIRPKFNLGDSDAAAVAEATRFANIQLGILDRHLADSDWLANNALSIADLFAFAYLEQHREVNFPIDEYANVKAWFDRVESRASIAEARAKLPA